MSLRIKQKKFALFGPFTFLPSLPHSFLLFGILQWDTENQPGWSTFVSLHPSARPAEPGFFLHKQGRKSSQRTLLTFPQKLKRRGGRI